MTTSKLFKSVSFIIFFLLFSGLVNAEAVKSRGVSRIKGSNVDVAIQEATKNALQSIIEQKLDEVIDRRSLQQYSFFIFREILNKPEQFFTSFRIIDQKNDKSLYIVNIEGIFEKRILSNTLRGIGLPLRTSPILNVHILDNIGIPGELSEHLNNLKINFTRSRIVLEADIKEEIKSAFETKPKLNAVFVLLGNREKSDSFYELSSYSLGSNKPDKVITFREPKKLSNNPNEINERLLMLINRDVLDISNISYSSGSEEKKGEKIIISGFSSPTEKIILLKFLLNNPSNPILSRFIPSRIFDDKVELNTYEVKEIDLVNAVDPNKDGFRLVRNFNRSSGKASSELKFVFKAQPEVKDPVYIEEKQGYFEREYNNTFYSYNTISDKPVSGALTSKIDSDIFKFNSSGKTSLKISLTGSGSGNLNPVIKIFDSQFNILKSSSIPKGNTNSIQFDINDELVGENTIFIKLEDEFGQDGISVGAIDSYEYVLSVK